MRASTLSRASCLDLHLCRGLGTGERKSWRERGAEGGGRCRSRRASRAAAATLGGRRRGPADARERRPAVWAVFPRSAAATRSLSGGRPGTGTGPLSHSLVTFGKRGPHRGCLSLDGQASRRRSPFLIRGGPLRRICSRRAIGGTRASLWRPVRSRRACLIVGCFFFFPLRDADTPGDPRFVLISRGRLAVSACCSVWAAPPLLRLRAVSQRSSLS